MDFMTSTFSDNTVEEANDQFNYKKKAVTSTVTEKRKNNGDKNDYNFLQPENDNGNVEYKAQLVNVSPNRLTHLITQLKWRLREGQGEAIYEIGVAEDGAMQGLDDAGLAASMETLRKMVDSLEASLVILSEKDVSAGPKQRLRVVKVLVRKVFDSQQFIDLKLAVIGSAEAGKSTLCGVLTHGERDNGHGKVRLNLFRYLHEIRTGKTSSICLDMIGFDSMGNLINYENQTSPAEIVDRSSKLITLIDPPGDRKYMKTTIYGLTAYAPHFCALVVNARTGVTAVTKEHLGIAALALNLPFFVVVSKIDTLTQKHLDNVLKQVDKLVNSIGKKTMVVRTREEAFNAAASLTTLKSVPVISTSSVTGENIDLLSAFLNVLPPRETSKSKHVQLSRKPPVFHVEELFNVPNVGDVLYGYLTEGVLHEGDSVRIGPDTCGDYLPARISSIRRNRQPVMSVYPGEAATIAIETKEKDVDLQLRRGMTMLSSKDIGLSCYEFIARFYLLHHPYNEVCVGFQGTVFIGVVCQTATIVALDRPSICSCVWMTVRFKFYRNPEYVRVGSTLIFREGRTKGMGEVLEIVEPIITE